MNLPIQIDPLIEIVWKVHLLIKTINLPLLLLKENKVTAHKDKETGEVSKGKEEQITSKIKMDSKIKLKKFRFITRIELKMWA